MLEMAEIQYIKHLREQEGKSIQAIADTLNINWRTAKKYADCGDFNLPSKRKRQRHVMEPYETIIDAWLLDDRNMPKKQRHTAKRIYDRLVLEHGFHGGSRTVRRYVSNRRSRLGSQGEKYIKLLHHQAHTQADFGKFHAFRNGCLISFQYLVLSFPYSNAGFAQVLPGENSECLLEGLKWIFQHLGGVPRRIRLDNLSPAVVKVLKGGNREITESFERFCLHYGFEAEFCNVRKANEKGHVEGKIGYSRRNWFVPIPSIDDILAYNQQLFAEAEEDLNRPHYEKKVILRDLFSQEQADLLLLPTVPFEVARWETATVDKYGRVKLDEYHYHGVPASPGDRVFLKAYWNILQILNQDYEIIAQYPRVYHQNAEAVNWQIQFMIFSQKPRAVPHSVHFQLLPPSIQEYLSIEDTQELKQRLRLLSQLAEEHKLEILARAIAGAKEDGQSDTGAIRHELYRLTTPERLIPMMEAYTPICLQGYKPDLSRYDQLAIENGLESELQGVE